LLFQRRMKNKLGYFRIFAIILLVFTQGCLDLISQNPKDNFKSGKNPRILEEIASQKHELTPAIRAEIIKQHELDKKNSKILRVAVIDGGIDLAQPDLYKKISFKIENGKIVGAGADVMGRGSFPSYINVDPWLYAFGAQDVEDVGGRIVGEIESPLSLLKQMNQEFVKRLLAAVRSHPVLSQSLFAKLNETNFTLAGMYHGIQGKDFFSQSDYDSYKKENELIGVSSPLSKKLKSGEEIPNDAVYSFLKPWRLDLETGLPRPFNNFSAEITNVEHSDVFFEVLQTVFKDFDRQFKFERNVRLMEKFKLERTAKKSDREDVPEETRKKLIEAMNFALLGHKIYDPVESLRDTLLEKLDPYNKRQNMSLAQLLEATFAEFKEHLAVLKTHSEAEKEDIEKIEKWILKLGDLKTMSSIVEKLEGNSPEAVRLRLKLKHWNMRYKHPYIDPTTEGNSHHTHVAGIVAGPAQGSHVDGIIGDVSENIRIFPIRVTTQTIMRPNDDKDLLDKYSKEMAAWLELPMVQELIKEIYSEYGKKPSANEDVLKAISKQ
jgi:hypothetical protein